MLKKIIVSAIVVTTVIVASSIVVLAQNSNQHPVSASSTVNQSDSNKSKLTEEEHEAYGKEMIEKFMSGEIKIPEPGEKVYIDQKGWEGVYMVAGESRSESDKSSSSASE